MRIVLDEETWVSELEGIDLEFGDPSQQFNGNGDGVASGFGSGDGFGEGNGDIFDETKFKNGINTGKGYGIGGSSHGNGIGIDINIREKKLLKLINNKACMKPWTNPIIPILIAINIRNFRDDNNR
jgi:hypothetical protein